MATEQTCTLILSLPTFSMNITIPTSLLPGQQVQVFDPDEPPTEWVVFTVIQVSEQRIELLSPLQEKTWAESSLGRCYSAINQA